MKIKLTWLILLLPLMSCEKTESQNNPNVDINRIYGSWNWFQSSGGIAGKTETPATTGTRRRLIFSRNGQLTSYINDERAASESFELVKEGSMNDVGQEYYMIVSSALGLKTAILRLRNDTLILSQEVKDGYIAGYVRQK